MNCCCCCIRHRVSLLFLGQQHRLLVYSSEPHVWLYTFSWHSKVFFDKTATTKRLFVLCGRMFLIQLLHCAAKNKFYKNVGKNEYMTILGSARFLHQEICRCVCRGAGNGWENCGKHDMNWCLVVLCVCSWKHAARASLWTVHKARRLLIRYSTDLNTDNMHSAQVWWWTFCKPARH